MAQDTEESPTLDRCGAIVGEGEAARPCGRYVAANSGRYCPEHAAQHEPRCCEVMPGGRPCENPALPGTKFCGEHLHGREVLYPGPCPEQGEGKVMARLNWAFQRLQYERPDIYDLVGSGDDAQFAQGAAVVFAILKAPDGPIPEPATVRLREYMGTITYVIEALNDDASAQALKQRLLDATTLRPIGPDTPPLGKVFWADVEAGNRFTFEVQIPADSPLNEVLTSQEPGPDPWFDTLTIVRQNVPVTIHDKDGNFKSNSTALEIRTNIRTVFHVLPENAVGCFIHEYWVQWPYSEDLAKALPLEKVRERNARLNLLPPEQFRQPQAPVLLEEHKHKRPRARRGPIPQITAQEIRNPAIALADGPFKLRWQATTGETALVHIIPGDPVQTKLTALTLPWWGLAPENANLWNVLTTHGGIPAVLLLFETMGRLLELPPGKAHVRVSLDELAQATGFLRQRTTAGRLVARKQVYLALLLLEGLEVHGCRNGKWRDPKTGEVLDLHSQDPLLRITGKRMPAQGTFDESHVPFEVSFTYGAWLERFHGNRQILSDIGDFRRLAAIPAGQNAGALAQRIGLALQQRWREQASYAEIGHVGEANRPTLRLANYFTRRGLCQLFRGEPDIEAMLKTDDPGRARKYWRQAIAMLGRKQREDDTEHVGLIGFYKELDPMLPTGSGIGGWQEFWYNEQRLDIRPCQEITAQVAEVNTAAKTARAARAARARKRAGERAKAPEQV